MPGAPFRTAVFDMDGLLLDTERPVRQAWLHASASVGKPLGNDEYLALVGLNHRASEALLLAHFAADPARLAAAAKAAQAWLATEFGERPFDLKPGARALLESLREGGIRCGVASSTHRAEVVKRLSAAGLMGFFEAVCGGDEVVHGKPAPDLYALAVARLGADAAATLAFEDSGHGVQAALAAGLAVVNVPDLKAPEPAWQARCLAVLPTLDAALSHRAAWFGSR